MEKEITKEEFRAYISVQESGVTNMFALLVVADLSRLNVDTITTIMRDYGELCDKYPDVAEEIT